MKFISRVVLPLILFAYISVEAILKLQKSSLCSSTGCELAEQLLRFDSIQLYFVGIAGALFIAVVGYLSIKRDSFEKYFFIVLYSAIAFETIMIAYQVIANPEPCKFCMGVYSLLLTTAILSQWRYLLYFLPVIGAIAVSLASLSITENKVIAGQNGYYLISSSTCPHCKKVKAYMRTENINFTSIASTDANARSFMKDLNITQIPVLVDMNNNRIQVIKGDKIIIEHLKGNKEGQATQADSNIYDQEASGCEASPSALDEPGCEEEGILNSGSTSRF